MGYQQQKKSEAFRGREISRETSLVSRLLRAYTAQLETLRRLRNGGTQLVRVEHVHVNEGGKAIIGRWLADWETAAILSRRLEQMGLEERVPGDREIWRSTPLGRELHSDLLMVFLVLWDEPRCAIRQCPVATLDGAED